MNAVFDLMDQYGPEQVLHVSNPAAGLSAIIVVDNTACGPAIGGTRMAPNVTLEECARLARAMSLKNAAAGIPHGGAKSVIVADPTMARAKKEDILRAFARALIDMRQYIPGPDMGTDETSMAWIHDETGGSVGLPREIGGIPLDEIGATGFGLAIAAEVAQEFSNTPLQGARVAIQGFGAVGQHAARQLALRGAVLVAASDSQGTAYDPSGLDVDALVQLKQDTGALSGHGAAETLDRDDIIGIDCDIWIPAARPDVLNKENAADLKAKLVLQGANIPATPEAEAILYERGILSVPDFIANAGGVIRAAVEHRGGAETDAFASIQDKIERNTRHVLAQARETNSPPPREAALALAQSRLERTMSLRRWATKR